MSGEGIACRGCGCAVGNKVTHSWKRFVQWGGNSKTIVRRRRVCRHCGLAFTTIETHEDPQEIDKPEGFILDPLAKINQVKAKNPYLPG